MLYLILILANLSNTVMLIMFISNFADMFLASSDHTIMRFGHFTMNARNQSYIFLNTLEGYGFKVNLHYEE